MSREVNTKFVTHEDESTIDGAHVINIVGLNWIEGRLKLKAEWSMEHQTTWEELKDLKEDFPRILNQKKKRRKITKTPTFKYGVQVPRNVKHGFELDRVNGNSNWAGAMKAKMKDLFNLEAFNIQSAGYHPGPTYQPTTFTIIFDMKQDLRQKARLVAGGHLLDPMDHSVYSSTVKGISVKLLHVITHKTKLEDLCGNVSLAFVNACTLEKVYAMAGPEFGRAQRKNRSGYPESFVGFMYQLPTMALSFCRYPTKHGLRAILF
jgi:hypothetical protein